MNKELMYKSWDQISISLYKEIVEITERDITPVEKDLAVLALLMGISEEEIYDIGVNELSELRFQMEFLDNFKFNENWKSKKIVLNGKTYEVCVDLTKFSIAQYVDFQTYWAKKDNISYMSNLLSCFIIPKGKKYNTDYDITETINDIENYLPITVANSVLFFFLKESLTSIKVFQTCLDWRIKKMKNKQNKEKVEKLQEKMKVMWEAVFNGLV